MTKSPRPLAFIAVLKARPDKQQELRAGLLELIEPTRAEAGNLDYTLFAVRDEPGTFYMREAFADQAALDTHHATPHFRAFAAGMGELLADPIRVISLEQLSG